MLTGLILRPRLTLARVAERGTARPGLFAMLLLGAFYAAFALLLHLRGHAPSVTLVPIPRAQYYLWQAVFVAPLFALLWLVYGAVAHGLARIARGRGTLRATLAVLGVAYGVSILLLFVLPDVVVFLAAGHAALGKAMRFYAPAALVACIALSTVGLMEAQRLRAASALAITLVSFFVQAALGGILLR